MRLLVYLKILSPQRFGRRLGYLKEKSHFTMRRRIGGAVPVLRIKCLRENPEVRIQKFFMNSLVLNTTLLLGRNSTPTATVGALWRSGTRCLWSTSKILTERLINSLNKMLTSAEALNASLLRH